MSMQFNDNPCEDNEILLRDDNYFKRFVARLLCRIFNKNDLATYTPDNRLPVDAHITNNVVVNTPAGGATSALQTAGNSSLSSINSKLDTVATTALQTSANNLLTSIDSKVGVSPSAQEYAFAFAEDATYTYLGWALPGTLESAANWKVARIHNTTNRKEWADGNANFDNVWSGYSGLSYV